LIICFLLEKLKNRARQQSKGAVFGYAGNPASRTPATCFHYTLNDEKKKEGAVRGAALRHHRPVPAAGRSREQKSSALSQIGEGQRITGRGHPQGCLSGDRHYSVSA
jgi:hypothetical protein